MYYTHFLINVATCHGMSCFEYFSKKILKDEIATSSNLETVELLEMTEQEKI